VTPRIGERVALAAPQPTTAWWRDVGAELVPAS
jgi:hypothetical protein